MVYSSNKPKWYIRMLNDMLTPVSAKQAEKYADVFHKQLSGRNILVWTEDETPIVPTNSGIYISSFSGISVTEYRRKYLATLDEYKRQLVIPYEVFCNMEDVNLQNAKSLMDRTYLKLLFAAADKDVDQIVLFGSSYELGSLKDDLFANLREFADDIEAGKHIGSRDFHESYIRTIARMLHKDPERAAQLRAIADKGENFTLKDVWKNLSEITSICINPDESQLSEFDGIPLKCSVIANEMGVIAKVTENNGIYMLLRDEIFYEFIPEQASENDRPVLAEDLRVGDRVTPVATTDAGLYRVPLRFMIEITGIESGNILFSLC